MTRTHSVRAAIAALIVTAFGLGATGAARAEIVTLNVGEQLPAPCLDGECAVGLGFANGAGALKFSSNLIGALNAGGISVHEVSPATLAAELRTNGQYKSVSVSAPIVSLTGDFDGTNLAVKTVTTTGGALQTAPIDPEGFATTGGSLEIKNLKVDLSQKRIYATLVGANGVGQIDNLYLWDIATITGSTTLSPNYGSASNSLKGLSINKPAFDLFAQSLGLTEAGMSALQTVTDYGQIDSVISAVPESSTYAMMGLGLVGLCMVRRRQAA